MGSTDGALLKNLLTFEWSQHEQDEADEHFCRAQPRKQTVLQTPSKVLQRQLDAGRKARLDGIGKANELGLCVCARRVCMHGARGWANIVRTRVQVKDLGV